MNTQTTFKAGALVAPLNIASICAARDVALDQMNEAIDQIAGGFALARDAAQTAKGASAGHKCHLLYDTNKRVEKDLFPEFDRDAVAARYKASLDAAIWVRVIEETRLKELMDTTERDQLDAQMASGEMPEPNYENIHATLDRLNSDAELIFQRGVARAFARLSPAFKSHDAFKIGRRMIFERVFDDWGHWSYSGHGQSIRRILADVERVFSQLNGDRTYGEIEAAIEDSRRAGRGAQQSDVTGSYFTARTFMNGNLHLWINDADLLKKVNRVLAVYYGEVLPDAAEATKAPSDFQPGTALARDLAFYATPPAAVECLLKDLNVKQGARILEPSAGMGAICKPLLARGAVVDAVEVHPERAATLRGMGHPALTVRCANFLKLPATPIYDLVLMNPPFVGTHWMDHVKHAFDFLAPNGELRAILPASAEVGSTKKHDTFRAWASKHAPRGWMRGLWRDLPAESFASVGTRINTVVLTLTK